ncbi:substrate-binding domain-containing protein [Roseiarcaceae bacterium H3SJ34-1]|uniref:molybdate ABC transporter substrate-binding protein n=1 Tax=Terripilifer ovatus TaxID=3032367 RepID=UPI003AB94031|nr:substrate-binding domain-containing protein [Roseiarcaceae bacterium H3SJ34-1]
MGERDDPQLVVWTAGSTLPGLRAAVTAAGLAGIDVRTNHGHLIEQACLEYRLDGDIVMLPDAMIDKLAAAGKIGAGRLPLGIVPIGAALRTGRTPPDVSTLDAMKAAIDKADRIALTLAPSGDHLMEVFQCLGVLPLVEAKLVRFDTSTMVNEHMAASDDDVLGFGPASEIIAWRNRGIVYAGPLHETIQMALPYSAAILGQARNKAAAVTLLKRLDTDEARASFKDSGVV